MKTTASLACAALLLAGCSSDTLEAPAPFCAIGLEGADIVVDDNACPSCDVDNPDRVVDGNTETFMSVLFPTNGGQLRFRITASDDQPFDATTNPGALMLFPPGRYPEAGFQVRLFLDNQPAGSSNQFVSDGAPEGAGMATYYSVTPDSAFNGAEVTLGISGNPDPISVLVFEACADR